MTSSVDLSGITSSSFGSCWDSFSSFDVLFSVCFFLSCDFAYQIDVGGFYVTLSPFRVSGVIF